MKEVIVRLTSDRIKVKGGEYVRDIVRCAECKYEPICTHSVQHTTRDAHTVTIGYKSVEWCSYGERREPL